MIRLSNLFWDIVFGWRFLLVSAIVCAVVLTEVKYVKDQKNAALLAQNESETISIEEIEAQLTEEEQARLSEANNLRVQVEGQEQYQKESVRINLDAYAENIVVLQYYVNTNYSFNINEDIVPDHVNDIIAAYVSYIGNNGIHKELGKQLQWDIDECYIDELVCANINNTGDMFTVQILGADADKADELADAVAASVAQYQSNLIEKIGEHELVMVDRYSSVVIDNNLATEQSKLETSIKTLRANLAAVVAEFSSNQLAVWNMESNMAEGEEEEPQPIVVPVPTVSVKYILLGAFVGIFLSCIWIVCRCLLNARLQNVGELQQMYGVRSFGNLADAVPKKRILGCVDRWLSSLREKEQWTAEERRELVVTNMKVTCKKEQIERIFLTSVIHMTEADKTQISLLIEELQKFGIKAEFGECITSNAESVEQMSEYGQVVLVEKVGVSKYEAVGKEIGLCCDQGVNVLGAVVL